MTKVLYVEDHETQRDIMVQMLELYAKALKEIVHHTSEALRSGCL